MGVEQRFVATILVTDPDTGWPAEIKIYKLTDGQFVGVDNDYLAALPHDRPARFATDGYKLRNPYGPGLINLEAEMTAAATKMEETIALASSIVHSSRASPFQCQLCGSNSHNSMDCDRPYHQ